MLHNQWIKFLIIVPLTQNNIDFPYHWLNHLILESSELLMGWLNHLLPVMCELLNQKGCQSAHQFPSLKAAINQTVYQHLLTLHSHQFLFVANINHLNSFLVACSCLSISFLHAVAFPDNPCELSRHGKQKL